MSPFDLVQKAFGLPDNFQQKFWRRGPIAGVNNLVNSMPSLKPGRADEILANSPPVYAVTVSQAGSIIDGDAYSQIRVFSDAEHSVVDAGKIDVLLERGCTCIIANAEHWVSECREVTATISSRLQHEVQSHIFLTGPGSRGLVPHVDGEDNFLVQIEGSKTWSLWESTRHLPTYFDAASLGTPDLQVELLPGQSLYIPIGWVHSATAGSSRSVHVTYQIIPKHAADVVLDEFERVARNILGEKLVDINQEDSGVVQAYLLRVLEELRGGS